MERHPLDSGICSARGRCWSSVPDHGATTHVLPRTHKPTMRACNRPCSPFLASFPGAHSNNRLRVSWHRLAAPAFWASWADALPMFRVPTERTLARVCREAGASVRCNAKLREMNIAVSVSEERSVEVLASGLPAHHGAQLVVDITLRSALTAQGEARPNAAHVNGAVLAAARREKAAKYWELLEGGRCHLDGVAIETGGRWSEEALGFIEMLIRARARDASPSLRRSAFLAWRRRWSRMISISCSRAFACSLISSPANAWEGTEGAAPDFTDLFLEA